MHTNAQQGSRLERATSRPVQRGLRSVSAAGSCWRTSSPACSCLASGRRRLRRLRRRRSGASSPPPLGIYLGYENTSGVSSLGDAIGQQPSYAMDYLDGTSWSNMESGAANEAAAWSSSGHTMTFSIPMLPNSGATLADGAAGDYNSYFETIAQGLVANNEASSILRIGWEFNGNWTPWYADASNASVFVAFWQQIVNTMRAVPGADFKFEWCPDTRRPGRRQPRQLLPGQRLRRLRGRGRLRPGLGHLPRGSSRVLRPRDRSPTGSTGSPRSPRSRASRWPSGSGGWATDRATPGRRIPTATSRCPEATIRPSSTTWRSGSSPITSPRPPTSTSSPWR